MPVNSSDIKMYLSGGAANSDPNASLGGARSNTEFVTATLENLFANISFTEAAAGSTKYRCVYVRQESLTNIWEDAGIYILQETPSADTEIALGLGTSGMNGTEQSVIDEDTPPVGVSFSRPLDAASRILFGGDMATNDFVAVWARRTVSPGASASALDNVIWEAIGGSLP